jgi:hypothetical protein
MRTVIFLWVLAAVNIALGVLNAVLFFSGLGSVFNAVVVLVNFGAAGFVATTASATKARYRMINGLDDISRRYG